MYRKGIIGRAVAMGMLALAVASCGRQEKVTLEPSDFTPYIIGDSSRIVSYPDGMRIYVVEPGTGDISQNGDKVLMHYQGRLDDGTIFDDSYSRAEPLEFQVGSGKVIQGIDLTARRLRLGTKAIAVIPPSLGYGDGKGDGKDKPKLPPKIPANATLTFHLHLVGSF